MRILDRHIRSHVFGMCLVVGLALTGISGFITLVEELDDLGQGTYGLFEIASVTALKLPETVYEMFPLIVLLGAIMGLGTLASAGELVVMQSAGISVLQIAMSALKGGVILGLLCLLLGDVAVPLSRNAAEAIRVQARWGPDANIKRSVWLRDSDRFVRIGALRSDSALDDITVLTVNPNDGRLVQAAHMGHAEFDDGRWTVREQRVSEITYSSVITRELAQADWPVALRPDLLKLFILKSDTLSLRGLDTYIEYLKSNGLDSTAPRFSYWKKINAPLSVLVMILLSVPFVLGSLRDTGAGQRLFLGVMVGIGFYLVNEVTNSLGQVFGLSPVLCAFGPTATLAALAIWRLQTLGRR